MAGVVARGTRVAVMLTVIAVLAFVALLGATRAGWLSVFGIRSDSTDSQIVQAIERTQDVSLLSLSVQGVKQQSDSGTIFGWQVPGTREKVVLIYKFTAKLGLDGSEVEVSREGPHRYAVEIPSFKAIGFDSPTFEVAAEDGSILSALVPDIDKVGMINQILDDDAKAQYVEDNVEALRSQTKVFYDGLIRSIDPQAETSYTFG